MKSTRNKFMLAFITLLLSFTFILAGCSAEKEEVQEEKPATETESDTTESTAYTVEHAMETTEIPSNPQKVVILTNEGTEALLAMGITPIGAVKSWSGDPWYPHIAEQMEGVQVVGTESEVNVEAIAALQPDLIIGNKARQEEIYEQLKAIAPTVFAERLRGDWQENFKLYSKAVNKEDEGNKVLADFNARIDSLKSSVDLDTEISVVRFMGDHTRIYYKDTFSGVIFDQIGLKRPENLEALFADKPEDMFMRKVGKEGIPEMDGDVIFYFSYETGDGSATATETEMTTDPLWQNLSAVKAGNVYKVDDAVWNTAGGVLAANLMLEDLENYLTKE
ncbi:iron-siderophore ABC transporter substrate-binding protein [Cytobacillus sp. S13-E01]|uniref:ABC transporter substrate-binding protein n=1 Tax=Cytobacillus sp. S13-E01 TaxID=3031326 RepID=UPI0023D82B73|nr:iron-siderophore ABC transporter substrate-binding protein [Cytobacillus sp. S13-E01]MDF0728075.1 iron-siderophore ABC transporter substrate-binding protein [Cytobacillus sp. S13-E01]